MTHLFAKAGISLERLHTFVEIASTGSISQAAPANPTRQSQFSRQLKELEDFFGIELIRRGPGFFELTVAGRKLFQIAQSHFNALENFAGECANATSAVTLGGGESLLRSLVLPGIREFRSSNPGVVLTLENMRTQEVKERLVSGQLDLGLMRQNAVASPLKAMRVGTIKYRLVMPPTAGITPKTKFSWTMLSNQPLALLSGSTVTEAFEAAAAKQGIELEVGVRCSSYSQLIEAATKIHCATILPNFMVRSLAGDYEVVDFPALNPFCMAIGLAWNPRLCELQPRMVSIVDSLVKIFRSGIRPFDSEKE